MSEMILKSILFGALVIGSPMLFAQGQATNAEPSAISAEGPSKHAKLSRKDAKKQCLDENPSLKGKDLKSCIKTKLSS